MQEVVVPQKIKKVVVHPLVLLSVVDHFNRMGKVGNVKRVVGVLLGSYRQGVLDVSNSCAGEYFTSIWTRTKEPRSNFKFPFPLILYTGVGVSLLLF